MPKCRAVLFAVTVTLVGCGSPDQGAGTPRATTSIGAPRDSTLQTSPVTPEAEVELDTTHFRGPRLLTDTLAVEPRLELRGDEYVVHIPAAMAKVLYDSLSEFAPRPLSAWEPAVVAHLTSRSPGAVLPSVVLGDFNGDSKLDIAMAGNSGPTYAMFMLLAKSDSVPEPKILLIGWGEAATGMADSYIGLVRPQTIRVSPELEPQPLELRTDALLDVTIEKAAVMYYLDRGVIRRYLTSD